MSNNPFQAGFQTGMELENQRKRNELLQMQAEMLKKKGDLENLQIEREQAAQKAPEDFLRSVQTMKPTQKELPNTAVMPDQNPTMDPRLAPGTHTGTVMAGPTAEDRLQNYMTAAAKTRGNPNSLAVLNTLANNDPVLGPHLKLQALRAKMVEEEMKLGYENRKTEFAANQDIRKTITGKAFDAQEKKANRKLDVKAAGDTGGFVIFDPYNPDSPTSATIMPDPKNPGQYIHQDLRGQPAYNVVESMLRQVPGTDKKTPEEVDAAVKAIQKNKQAYQQLVNGIGRQRSQANVTSPSTGIPQAGASSGGPVNWLMNKLGIIPGNSIAGSGGANTEAPGLPGKTYDQIRNDLYALRPDLAPAKSYDQIRRNLLASRSNANSPWNPQMESGRTVASELSSLYDKLKGIRGGGAENADEFGFPQGRHGQESETPQDSPTERFGKAGIVMNLAKTTTIGKASAELSRVFPELSQQQILRLLAPVTRSVGTGSGTDSAMVDLEALRQNIGDLYARSTAGGYLRRAVPHNAGDSLRRLIPKGQ